MATLELVGLQKSFGATPVLHGVDLSLADGEMLAIVGASGCGKSTLLRLVAGLEQPSAGNIILDGREISREDPARRDIAMVFQNYALYPHMTVFANMAYALKVRGLAAPDIRRRVEATARSLGLEALLERRPGQLSGGQRQRVAMGRAVVRDPKLFLFDEPLSNLDARLRIQVRAEIKSLQRRLGVTSLFVTHDQTEAMTLGDRLLVLRQGHVAQIGTPLDIYERPADTHVATFIGAPSMNLLSATSNDAGRAARLDAGPVLRFDHGGIDRPDGSRLTIGIRPEHVLPADDGLALAVDLVEPLGSETLVHGTLANGEKLSVKLPGGRQETRILAVELRAGDCHVFDETGRRMSLTPVEGALSAA